MNDDLISRLRSCSAIHQLPHEAADRIEAQAARIAEPVATFSEPVVLPDGSAFATASFPLPKDHWLYAPRGAWDSERDDFAETPHPILTNAQREAVRAAGRYAVRGATMCGKEPDFDPDALVQNLCYALCGPANAKVLPADAPPQPLTLSEGQLWILWNATNGCPNFEVFKDCARAVLAAAQEKL